MSNSSMAKVSVSAKEAGYRMPEEAEKHERTFMQWPVNNVVHSDPSFLKMLQQSIADVANTISEFEPVVMLMDAAYEKSARNRLSERVTIWHIPTDDLWCRDSGPLFVKNKDGGLAISDLNFNGWGNKQLHENDGRIARRVAEYLDLPVFDNGLVGEAGGFESDGQGTLIAHESSWINPNRNADSRQEVETRLLEAVGGDQLIWAPGVKGADITDYHIDSLARFVTPDTILIQLPDEIDTRDPWSASAYETYDILKTATKPGGGAFELLVLSEPFDTRVTSPDFVAAYVNYYICNGGVIAAEFGDRSKDEAAQTMLSDLYPDREIVMLNVDPIGETGGGIHCATQQQPAT
ncbi:MAG: agmatine deiminase family protein [Stappiaceae bacterium]